MRKRLALSAAILVGVIVPLRPARADFDLDGTWVSVGLNAGVSVGSSGTSTLVGGELSVVHLTKGGEWFGGYADVVTDRAASTGRLSVGPEVGIGPLGLDLGPAVEFGKGEPRYGFVVRPVFTAGFVGLYGRYAYIHETGSVGEFGLLLKRPDKM